MEINYLLILACGVVSIIIGSIWYGPLFGKLWLKVIGATEMDLAKRKEMQKKAMPLYVLQLFISLFQAYILALFVQDAGYTMAIQYALLTWAGFVIPTVAGACMWNNDSGKVSWIKFLLQSGGHLVTLVVFALILA